MVWFTQQRSLNVPINGPILASKAIEFAGRLGLTEFKASNGFLEKFKNRNGLVFKMVSGEACSADKVAASKWLAEILPKYMERFTSKDIYNADETALFYQMLPTKTLSFKGAQCTGSKLSKKRLTVLICANMDGSDRYKPLLIGKSKNPRCFKNQNLKSLPIIYKANKHAWMTAEIWQEWLTSFDSKMLKENRKVLLFVDNVSSHHKPITLKATELVYLPPNTTSVIQPCDQGIIRSFKINYRRRLMNKLLVWMDVKCTINDFKIDLLEAIYLCCGAWNDVSPTLIANSFHHAGFRKDERNFPHNANDQDQARNIFDFMKSHYSELFEDAAVTLEAYIDSDKVIQTECIFTDDQIINEVSNNKVKIPESICKFES